MRKCLVDGLLGNLIKNDTAVAAVVTPNGFAEVPGNGLPLSVQVRCEVDGVGVFGQLFELGDHFFLAGQNLITRLPAVFRIHTHARDQLLPRFFLFVCRFLLRAHGTRLGGLFGPFGRVSIIAAA